MKEYFLRTEKIQSSWPKSRKGTGISRLPESDPKILFTGFCKKQ